MTDSCSSFSNNEIKKSKAIPVGARRKTKMFDIEIPFPTKVFWLKRSAQNVDVNEDVSGLLTDQFSHRPLITGFTPAN